MAELLKVTTTEQMLAYHVWQQEFAMRELGRQTKRLGRTIETVVAVIDASGWTLSLATRTAYGYLKGAILPSPSRCSPFFRLVMSRVQVTLPHTP